MYLFYISRIVKKFIMKWEKKLQMNIAAYKTCSLKVQFSSFHFSRSVVSDSLWPHELQHAKPPCPSPSPGVHSNSRPLSRWCHPAISCSVTPFSSCPQSLPASESFPTSQLFTWGGQSTGVSASASVLPVSVQGWFPVGLTYVISQCVCSCGLLFSCF